MRRRVDIKERLEYIFEKKEERKIPRNLLLPLRKGSARVAETKDNTICTIFNDETKPFEKGSMNY